MTKPAETAVVLSKPAADVAEPASVASKPTTVVPEPASAVSDSTATASDIAATISRKASSRLLAVMVLPAILSFWLASCSSEASTSPQLGVDETLEPEIGYTGLDVTEAVAGFLGGNLSLATLDSPAQHSRYTENDTSTPDSENSFDSAGLPESKNLFDTPETLDSVGYPDSVNPVSPSNPSEDRVKLFPSLNGAQSALGEEIYSQDAETGVMTLRESGFSSQEICGSQPLIDDFALPEEKTQAIITPENAAPTAEDVKAAVWEYYEVVARTFQQPSAQGLLCLARVATLPKLEWKWEDLKVLVSEQLETNFLLPTEVHVVGLLTGSALAVACLPPLAYGELSADNQEIAALALLRWSGGRWRVSTTQDFPGENCRDRARFTQQSYEDDISDTGDAWILGGF